MMRKQADMVDVGVPYHATLPCHCTAALALVLVSWWQYTALFMCARSATEADKRDPAYSTGPTCWKASHDSSHFVVRIGATLSMG